MCVREEDFLFTWSFFARSEKEEEAPDETTRLANMVAKATRPGKRERERGTDAGKTHAAPCPRQAAAAHAGERGREPAICIVKINNSAFTLADPEKKVLV